MLFRRGKPVFCGCGQREGLSHAFRHSQVGRLGRLAANVYGRRQMDVVLAIYTTVVQITPAVYWQSWKGIRQVGKRWWELHPRSAVCCGYRKLSILVQKRLSFPPPQAVKVKQKQGSASAFGQNKWLAIQKETADSGPSMRGYILTRSKRWKENVWQRDINLISASAVSQIPDNSRYRADRYSAKMQTSHAIWAKEIKQTLPGT